MQHASWLGSSSPIIQCQKSILSANCLSILLTVKVYFQLALSLLALSFNYKHLNGFWHWICSNCTSRKLTSSDEQECPVSSWRPVFWDSLWQQQTGCTAGVWHTSRGVGTGCWRPDRTEKRPLRIKGNGFVCIHSAAFLQRGLTSGRQPHEQSYFSNNFCRFTRWHPIRATFRVSIHI